MENNCYLINAPAGSGKTTYIYNKIMEISIKYPKAKILCITYTNRATNELLGRFEYYNKTNLEVYTIHSFINKFIDNYFKKSQIIDDYFEEYGDKIKDIIDNKDDAKNQKKISRYIEKYGEEINYDKVRKNISKLYYNETNYNSFLYGGLSHDELIRFSYIISEKYENILFKLAKMYDYIFIDEYQDTPSYVLQIFYKSLKYSNVKLYLLGDKMQQIYDKYDRKFDQILNSFDKSISLNNNYRSSPKIVNILNNIYNNKNYNQISMSLLNSSDSKTVCIFTDNYELELKKYEDYYKLFLLNKEKYKQIGASNLYSSISSIEEYSFNGKFNVSDALNNNIEENKDMLFKPMYIINYIIELYKKNNYGEIVRTILKYNKIFDESNININDFMMINNMKDHLKKLAEEYNNDENTILSFLTNSRVLKDDYCEILLSNIEYEEVLKVSLLEYKNYTNYIKESNCSTQHGVKGEGHDNVIFVSESSSNPSIQMYEFYKYYSKSNIDIDQFESINDTYTNFIKLIEKKAEISLSLFTKDIYQMYLNEIEEIIDEMYESLKDSKLFDLIHDKYDKYICNKNVTNLKNFLKKEQISSIIAAYKIFYVGCSRAKKNLIILIDKRKTKEFQTELEIKFRMLGFDIEVN